MSRSALPDPSASSHEDMEIDTVSLVVTVDAAERAHHANPNEINAAANRLSAPKIRAVHSRSKEQQKEQQKQQGAITHWETPYNQPQFEAPKNVQYTRLAMQYLQQGRVDDAEKLYTQALVVAERTFKPGDSPIIRAIEDLAAFHFNHEKYKLAQPLVARLLAYRVEKLPCDDWLLIRTVDQLAEIYEKNGEALQAQSLYKLFLARQEEAFGRNSPVCAFTLSRLADSYLRQDHYAAAETLMLTILEIQENVHGRVSIEISTTLQELSKIYHKLRRYDKAAEMLERLLHVLEAIHGENGLSVASCLLKLADLLVEVGLNEQAEPLYRRAQEIYKLSYGDSTAAHSVFKKKLSLVNAANPISKLSKDKPADQEECSRFPAIRPNLEDMLPSKLGTGQVNRCLGHHVCHSPFETITDTQKTLLDELFDAGSNVELPPNPVPTPKDFQRTTLQMTKDLEETLKLPNHKDRVRMLESSHYAKPRVIHDPKDPRKTLVLPPVSQRETVKERPLLLPEPFPSSRRKTITQVLFPVSAPHRAKY